VTVRWLCYEAERFAMHRIEADREVFHNQSYFCDLLMHLVNCRRQSQVDEFVL